MALKAGVPVDPDEPVRRRAVWEAMQTALTMAADELRNAASSGAVDSPRQWQAVLEAAERVRAVLASLPQTRTGGRPARGQYRLLAARTGADAQAIQLLAERLRTAERVITAARRRRPSLAVSRRRDAAERAGRGGRTGTPSVEAPTRVADVGLAKCSSTGCGS